MSTIQELTTKIIEASEAYYLGEPIMTDVQFDNLCNELAKLDQYNPILKKVGFGLHVYKDEVKLPVTIRESLDKIKDISLYDKSTAEVTPKVDGMSILLHFKDGVLVAAYNRADGEYGIDITPKIQRTKIGNIKVSNEDLYIGAEAYISNITFNKHFLGKYALPRAAVSGILNAKGFDNCEKVDVVAFNITREGITYIGTKAKDLIYRLCSELPTVFSRQVTFSSLGGSLSLSNEDLSKYYSQLINSDLPVDGLVLNGEVAWKETNKGVEAEVDYVKWELSDKSRWIPVIVLKEPVKLYGTSVSCMSGFNYRFIESNKIRPGSIIEVTKHNEIIPGITKVIGINMIDCLICGSKFSDNTQLSKHLNKDHDLSFADYDWTYVQGNTESPLCVCGCGETRCIRRSKYGKFHNQSCKMKFMNTNPQYKEFQETRLLGYNESLENGMREDQKKRMNNLWKDNNFREKMNEVLSDSRRKLLEFKQSHEGMGPHEFRLFNHWLIQRLNPLHNDKRFWQGNKGGIELDISIPDIKVNIEIDGWEHNSIKDAERDEWLLKTHGWRTIRVSSEQVSDNIEETVKYIYEQLALEYKNSDSPTVCPNCNTELQLGTHAVCVGTCIDQMKVSLESFVASFFVPKGVADVKGIIDSLEILDPMTLKLLPINFRSLLVKKLGDSRGHMEADFLESRIMIPKGKFLESLNLPNVGYAQSVLFLPYLDKWIETAFTPPKDAFVNYLAEDSMIKNYSLIKNFYDVWKDRFFEESKVYYKYNVVLTGSGWATRAEIIEQAKGLGIQIVDSIEATTNYIVTSDVNSQSNKMKKARNLGIRVISYEEFREMLKS
jgi:NAD-dependent DNA ligase